MIGNILEKTGGKMILSKDEILKAIREGRITLTPFRSECIGPCSVDLHLGRKFRVFKKKRQKITISENERYDEYFDSVELGKSQGILLEPGELVLGVTEERIKLGKDLCARLDGRTRFARLGLLVHVSASLVQPGCDNVQVLEIINMSPWKMMLTPGLKVCQVVFEELRGKAEYRGRFRKQLAP